VPINSFICLSTRILRYRIDARSRYGRHYKRSVFLFVLDCLKNRTTIWIRNRPYRSSLTCWKIKPKKPPQQFYRCFWPLFSAGCRDGVSRVKKKKFFFALPLLINCRKYDTVRVRVYNALFRCARRINWRPSPRIKSSNQKKNIMNPCRCRWLVQLVSSPAPTLTPSAPYGPTGGVNLSLYSLLVSAVWSSPVVPIAVLRLMTDTLSRAPAPPKAKDPVLL